MRRAVIGGETAPGDFIVIWDELPIGRIHKTTGMGGKDAFNWSCALPNVPQPSNHRGRATTLEQAKDEFRRAWDDLKSQVSYDQIREARAIDAKR